MENAVLKRILLCAVLLALPGVGSSASWFPPIAAHYHLTGENQSSPIIVTGPGGGALERILSNQALVVRIDLQQASLSGYTVALSLNGAAPVSATVVNGVFQHDFGVLTQGQYTVAITVRKDGALVSQHQETLSVDRYIPTPEKPASLTLPGLVALGQPVTINWQAVTHADEYRLKVAANETVITEQAGILLTQTQWLATSLGSVDVSIQACNEGFCSSWSEPTSTIVMPMPSPVTSVTLPASAPVGSQFVVSWVMPDNTDFVSLSLTNAEGVVKREVNGLTTNTTTTSHNEIEPLWLTMQSCNALGCTVSNNQWPIDILIGPPGRVYNSRAVNYSVQTDERIQVTWDETAFASYYNVLVYRASSTQEQLLYQFGNVNGTSFDFTHRQADDLVIKLQACNEQGCGPISGSSPVFVRGVEPISNYTVSPEEVLTNEDIYLNWGPVANAENYQIEVRNSSNYSDVTYYTSTTNSYVVQYGQPGYINIMVRACESGHCGRGAWRTVKVNPRPLPNIPTGLTAPAQVTANVPFTLSWNSATNASSYNVNVLSSDGQTVIQRVTDITALNTSVTVSEPQTVKLTVEACSSGGCSAASQSVSVTVNSAIPDVLQNLQAKVENGNDIVITWDAVEGVTHYERQYNKNNNGWLPSAPSIHVASDAPPIVFPDQPAYDVYYRLRACVNENCAQDWTLSNQITVPENGGDIPIPTGLTGPLEVLVGESFTLQWSTEPTLTYVVGKRASGDSAWQQVQESTAGSYTETNDAIGTYEFAVKACRQGTCSDWSAPLTIDVINITPSLFSPSNGELVSGTPRFTWSNTGSGVTYTVAVSTSARNANDVFAESWVKRGLASTEVSWDSTFVKVVRDPVTGEVQSEDAANTPASLAAGQTYYWHVVAMSGADTVKSAVGSFAVEQASGLLPATPNIYDGIPEETALASSRDSDSDKVGLSSGSFRVDESGAATYTVPINLPAGIAGITPQLALNYSSAKGNGPLGFGWSLSGLSSISRCRQTVESDGTSKPLTLTNEDRLCLDGQKLKVVDGSYGEDGAVYQTEIDTKTRVIGYGDIETSVGSFKVLREDGSVSYYGADDTLNDRSDSVIQRGDVGISWFIAAQRDHIENETSNTVYFNYLNGDEDFGSSEVVIDNISYSNNTVSFHYQTDVREDVTFGYVHGKRIASTALLDWIEVINHNNTTVRGYHLNYVKDDVNNLSQISGIKECYGASENVCLPETQFEYNTQATGQFRLPSNSVLSLGDNSIHQLIPFDLDGNGMNDLLYASVASESNSNRHYNLYVRYGNADSGYNSAVLLHSFSIPNHKELQIKPVDIDGDGVMEIVFAKNIGSTYQWAVWDAHGSDNDGDVNWRAPTFSNGAVVRLDLSFADTGKALVFQDVNTDALPDIVYRKGAVNYLRINLSDSAFSFGDAEVVPVNVPPTPFRSLSAPVGDSAPLSPLAQSLSTEDAENVIALPIDSPELQNLLVPNASLSQYDDSCLDPPDCFLDVGIIAMPSHLPPSDFNGDGRADTLMRMTAVHVGFGSLSTPTPEAPELIPRTSTFLMAFSLVNTPDGYEYQPVGTILNSVSEDLERGEPHYRETELYVADLNADGITDVIYKQKSERWGRNESWRLAYGKGITPDSVDSGDQFVDNFAYETALKIRDADRRVRDHDDVTGFQFVDVDKNGLVDIVYFDKVDKGWYSLNQTNEGFSDRQLLVSQGSYTTNDFVLLGDFNSDTYIDVAKLDAENKVLSMRKRSADKQEVAANKLRTITNGFGLKTTIDYELMAAVDNSNQPTVYQKLTGGLTSETSPVFNIIAPNTLVSRVVSQAPSNKNGTETLEELAVSYFYEGLRVQAGGRGSLGFSSITSYDEQANVSTTTYYRQDWPYIGMPSQTLKYIGTRVDNPDTEVEESKFLSKASNTYDEVALQGGVTYPYLKASTESVYSLDDAGDADLATTSLSHIVTTTHHVYANNHSEINAGSAATHALLKSVTVETKTPDTVTPLLKKTVVTENTYSSSNEVTTNGSWIINRVASTKVTHSETGKSDIVRESEFEYQDNGQLKLTKVGSVGDTHSYLETAYFYDDTFGHKTTTVQCSNHFADACVKDEDPATKNGRTTGGSSSSVDDATVIYRKSSVRYDVHSRYVLAANNGLFEPKVVNAADFNEFGQPTKTTHADGRVVEMKYGHFGQPYHTVDSLGNSTKVQRRFKENVADWSDVASIGVSDYYFVERQTSNTQPTVWTFYDRAARPVAVVKQGFGDSEYIYQYTRYDAFGRAVKQSVPSKASTPDYWTTTVYDDFGRVQSIESPDSTSTDISYNGLITTTTVTPDVGSYEQIQRETKDIFGRVIDSENCSLDGVCGSADNPTITYTYDATDNLTSATSNGTTVATQYDSLGRKQSMSDPDKGDWEYTYNALGELIAQKDAKSQKITFLYDALGRKVKQQDYATSTSTTPVQTATWVYDPANGRLNEVIQGSGFKDTYGYDDYGRVEQVTYLRDSSTFIALTRYDKYSRVAQQFDPVPQGDQCFISGVTVGTCWGLEYTYKNGYVETQFEARNGNDESRDSAYQYRKITQVDAFGNMAEFELGNGIKVNNNHDAKTGYLDTKMAQLLAAGDIMNANYVFDSYGNLLRRDRFTLKESAAATIHGTTHKVKGQRFTYDNLGRIKWMAQTGVSDFEVAVYDINGNIKNKYDVQGNADYEYGTSNNQCAGAGPHAVSKIGSLSFCYDANGNQTHSYDNGVLQREISYSIFDKATYISDAAGNTVSFQYGANRSRYKRVDFDAETSVTTTTYYVGNVEHVRRSDESFSAMRRNLPNVIHTVYSTGSDTINYVLTDHLGSVDTYTDKDGKILSKMYFDIWGTKQTIDNQYIVSSSSAVIAGSLTNVMGISPRGFTGHEHLDAFSIIHMNGRIYDPTLGRFLQADPHIQAPMNSQNYNRYSYVLNNPLSYTDPSGYFFKSLFKGIKKYWRVIAAAVVSVVTYGAASGWAAGWLAGTSLAGSQIAIGAIAGGITGFVGGAISSGSLKGALQGAFSGAVFGAIGGSFKAYGIENVGAQMGIHAVAGGIMSDLQGGKFGHGFFTAGVMKGFGKINFGDMNVIGRTVIQAMVGGTMSRVTGGKFANGAITSAIQFVVNEKSGWIQDRWQDLKSIGRDLSAFFNASELDVAGAGGYGLKVNSPNGVKINAQAKVAAGVRFTDNQAEQGFVLKGALALEAEAPFAKVGFGSIEGEGFFLPEKGHAYWKDPSIKGPKWELHDISLPNTNVFEASLTIQPLNINYKFDWNKFERLRNGG